MISTTRFHVAAATGQDLRTNIGNLEEWVILVGLAIGSVAVLTACVVWFLKQRFGVAGGMLCMTGIVLIGLSIWGRVSFQIGEITADLERLNRLASLNSAGVVELAQRVEVSQTEVVELARGIITEQRFDHGLEESIDRLEILAAGRPEAVQHLVATREAGLWQEPAELPTDVQAGEAALWETQIDELAAEIAEEAAETP